MAVGILLLCPGMGFDFELGGLWKGSGGWLMGFRREGEL